ncbi:hypothetical protein QBC40DRAFT_175791 [Triangularia verruculosa]|uniref:N-acetyltransferase domain-containing protein n=1 Tax=Triangularia verruculosa TaxID=2587418 RepID=A0AAN6XGE4_9PEZI|nr:hypothetical protein QBC40DRAFT_175791 [Triangularia verruculosa]
MATFTTTTTTTTTTTNPPTTTATTPSQTGGSVKVVATLTKRSLLPAAWNTQVRTVQSHECREAALSLAHAFQADDYARYLVDIESNPPVSTPNDHDSSSETTASSGSSVGFTWVGGLTSSKPTPESKWNLHVDILTYTVASHCIGGGLVTTVGEDFDSVALWVPPTGPHPPPSLDSYLTHFRSGLWRLHFQLCPEGKRRLFDEILPLLHDTKREVLGPEKENDVWYLVYLGTKPRSQGRGLGGKLLRDGMMKADREGKQMYLESSSAVNNEYYKKFGFEIKKEIYLKRGRWPVRLSVMVREPGAMGKGKEGGRKGGRVVG